MIEKLWRIYYIHEIIIIVRGAKKDMGNLKQGKVSNGNIHVHAGHVDVHILT